MCRRLFFFCYVQMEPLHILHQSTWACQGSHPWGPLPQSPAPALLLLQMQFCQQPPSSCPTQPGWIGGLPSAHQWPLHLIFQNTLDSTTLCRHSPPQIAGFCRSSIIFLKRTTILHICWFFCNRPQSRVLQIIFLKQAFSMLCSATYPQ